ncbi:MAG: hypothetical protein JJ940_02155 [Balneola sp.]|nr:hypothetical protein [Balneola sp.]MBO6711035.1 hypothetical protein [Balneola sp.]
MNHKRIVIDLERSGVLLLIALCLACSQVQSPELDRNFDAEQISPLDGKKIIHIQDKDFLNNAYLEAYKEQLITQYGSNLIDAVNDQVIKAKKNPGVAGEVLLLKDIPTIKAKTTGQALSSHIRVTDKDGKAEDFVLGIRHYVEDGRKYSKQIGSGVSEDNTWIALDPDRFYLEDDENGEEIWPITFEALHVGDVNRVLSVTFGKEGLLSAQEEGKAKMNSDPTLLFLDSAPMLDQPCDDPSLIITCDENGGSGSPGSGGRNNDWTRGSSTGTYGGNDTYFVIKSMRLAATGDGAGSSELQMFVKKDDNYQNNMPVSYKYRFDKVIRYDPVTTLITHNSIIDGGDQGWPYYIKYKVPDINNKEQDYDFNITRYDLKFGNYVSSNVDYFPLFNLSRTSGPWRFVLTDDDKDYPDFSQRRSDSYAGNIQTYHMDTGTWASVYTGFTTRSHTYGSSDDPIQESGVRRINLNNLNSRLFIGNSFTTTKWYGSDSFKYTFAKKTY